MAVPLRPQACHPLSSEPTNLAYRTKSLKVSHEDWVESRPNRRWQKRLRCKLKSYWLHTALISSLSAQLSGPSSSAKPLADEKALVLAWLPAAYDFSPLLLVWVEGAVNDGASATNCISASLLWGYQH